MPIGSISLPDKFLYSARYRVREDDISFADHLAAVRVLPIAIQVHESWLETVGHDPETSQFGLIMASSTVDYLTEARLGDVLSVDIAVAVAVNDRRLTRRDSANTGVDGIEDEFFEHCPGFDIKHVDSRIGA